MMKKILACILICVMCFTAGSFSAFAENESTVTWRGNYTDSQNPKLIISIDSAVRYNQQVAFSMYRADVTVPAYTDYCRLEEAAVEGKTKADVIIPIGNDLDYSEKHYKLKVTGSGIDALNINKLLDVYVLTANDITGTDGVLAALNAAQTPDAARSALGKVTKALQIEDSSVTEAMVQAFLTIKSEDFNNNFSSVAEVEKAWNISEMIVHLKSSGVTADSLKALTEKYISAVNINTEDEDYITYSSQTYANVISVKNTYVYNGQSGINSCKAFKNAIEQYQALNAINALSEVDTASYSKLAKYYTALEVTNEYQTKLENMKTDNSGNADKVLRVICDTSFTFPSEIKTKLEETIDKILNPDGSSGTDNGNNTETNSPLGGGGGGGGGSYNIQKEEKAEENNTTEFKDCNSSFWAYPYISELKEKNIINGYADGCFYPDNKVTREEFVKMILLSVGLYNAESECEFKDVSKDAWYYRYVASAVNEGIINGTDAEYFGTGKHITREDMAVIAARILNRFNKATASAAKEFTDGEQISGYAVESIEILSGMQLLDGFEDGTFRPKNNLTRAEAAKIISVIMKTV